MKHGQITKLAALVAMAALNAYAEERKRIIVSIPDRKLVLLSGSRVVKVYDVAVGKASTPTPDGEFKIVTRIPNPTWYGPDGPVAPGKGNPIGTRWMGLGYKGYGIHGTNAPRSIGKAASHGCVRMRQRDLEELFELVNVGTPVELRQERPPVVAMILAVSVVAAD